MGRFLVAFLFLLSVSAFALQAPWAKSYGKDDGTYSASAISIVQDEVYIITGTFNLGSKY